MIETSLRLPFARALVLALLVCSLSACADGAGPEPDPRGVERTPAIGASRAAITVETGFTDETIVSGLSNPTAMAFAPDGRLFVCEQGGRLRVIKNGALLSAPFLTVTVSSTGERGLLGVAFDPAFASNGFVYVYYTATSPTVHNRLSRFTASGDVAVAGSERVLLDLETLNATNHNGGALRFGKDGKLYVAVGENADGAHSQTLSNKLGKILRLNADGTIPTDNPFYTSASGTNRSIWALGLRNPFTIDVQPGTGRLFINDVGQSTWEEIDEGVAGANYGWPTTEGATSDARFRGPLHAYDHGGGACAITGGAFYNPATAPFPSGYVGHYFFADYCAGWIRRLDPSTGVATGFASGLGAPVDLRVGADGALYYLARTGGVVGRIRANTTNQPPQITGHPASRTVAAGQPATFTVTASGTAPLSYKWQRNGVDIAGATSASYTIGATTAADSGATFRAMVSNAHGAATSNAATLTVTSNQAPTASITTPAAGATYAAGETIAYAGAGSDPEDGALPAAAFTWQVDFHHDTHTHPFLPATSGATSGSFVVPTTGETAANVFYRIHLTVKDAAGVAHSTFRDVLPRTTSITLQTDPPGLQVTLDGQPVTTPHTVKSVVGVTRALGVVSPQTSAGTTYRFSSWSDGGAASHDVATPATETTYTARFAADAAFSVKVNFQPSTGTLPSGYLRDAGAVFGSRGNGHSYGWNADNAAQTRDRNASNSSDQRYDTLTHLQKPALPNAVWELAVPSGAYQVRVVAGDPSHIDSVFRLDVEGVRVVDGTPTSSTRWIEGTKTVTVTDGRLTLTNGAGASNNKVCFIEVTRQ